MKLNGTISLLGLIAIQAFVMSPVLVRPASAQMRFSYTKGQVIQPSYEGWMKNADGSYTLYFGYMNPNWDQQLDVPVGPDNHFDPGGVDQGQPTHFYPRRNPFLFTIKVPKEYGAKELVWTLTTNGKTEKAYASLKEDYLIDPQVISTEVGGDMGSLRDELRYNIPPELEIKGETKITVKMGEPYTLVALAGDPDNLPARRDGKAQPLHPGKPAVVAEVKKSAAVLRPAAAVNSPGVVYRPPSSVVVSSGPGLRFSWTVYRGKASAVTFSPEQMKTYQDSRAYANSPWSPPYAIPEPPPNGEWDTKVTFDEPGTYVLRGIASDGSMFTYQNVTVTVTK